MTDSIVSLTAARTGKPAAAEYCRELADRLERGEIGDIVMVFNDIEGQHFERFGDFSDRWRLLGALEYAKSVVDRS